MTDRIYELLPMLPLLTAGFVYATMLVARPRRAHMRNLSAQLLLEAMKKAKGP